MLPFQASNVKEKKTKNEIGMKTGLTRVFKSPSREQHIHAVRSIWMKQKVAHFLYFLTFKRIVCETNI